DPAGWHTSIPTYRSIVYEQLYRGIDLLYDGSEGVLKGTYLVVPGANPGEIRWRYEGASSVELSKGELLISVTGTAETVPVAHRLVERRPVAWQMVAGKRRLVSVRYVIHDDGNIGFALGEYDATQPLMIDPTLDYSTYVGGSGEESSFGIAVDSGNNVIVAGSTDSLDFPSSGSGGIAGDRDIFVTKLDPSQAGANQLIYTTFIGGNGRDHAYGIKVDSSGNVYVAGYSESDNFPATANAFDQTYGGNRDAVVVQLDIAGAVNYASYLGGEYFDEAHQVVIGDNTLMYVVGYTNSEGLAPFPTTGDAFQTNHAGAGDAFVAVVDPSEFGPSSLVYSTYYGGAGWDAGWALDVSEGIIYFAGHTSSDPLPLRNAIQQNYGGAGFLGYGDAYIAKLDPSQFGNDQLLFATYLGGIGDDFGAGIAADASGNVYAVGFTGSADFPTTDVSPPYGGVFSDAFLAKIRTNGSSLAYSRFVGGSGNDGSMAVVLDPSGSVYVAGGTGSDDFPTVNPIQADFRGGVAPDPLYSLLGPADAFVAEFDTGGAMTFGTYFGGTGAEAATGIALGAPGSVYVMGVTASMDLDTVNHFQGANAGDFDVFIARIKKPTLTVNKDGSGTGTVTSDPAGINCGADCTEPYVKDMVVTLTATPDANSGFTGWSRDCSGTDPTTTVTMDADKTCTATFGYPIGGVVVPVNKFELLLPWLGLAALISLAALTVALARRRKA
ncbi:MAG: SBBP repeat-containing protein, partial [Anaerolineales bacterium]